MNERIKELASTIDRIRDFYDVGPVHRAALEDFAELIIRDCITTIQMKIPREGKTPENLRSYQHVRDIKTKFDFELPVGYNRHEGDDSNIDEQLRNRSTYFGNNP